MSDTVEAYAAMEKGGPLESYSYDPGPLGPEQVEIAVSHCGICHSDISMIDNEWGQSEYPLVPGHEVAGTVVSAGEQVKGLEVGQRVGLGWNSRSCMTCRQCLSGNHNLCEDAEGTIVGRHGGFATRVRAHWAWAVPLPEGLDAVNAGPLFCGGATVFTPMVQFGVRPTDRVGVVGIGGLGHMALQFLHKWGCEVVAFTSSEAKEEEARKLGAHRVVNSRDTDSMRAVTGLDFLISTVNVPLEWKVLLGTLAPKGRLHLVGAVLEPIPVEAFDLIPGQRSLSGSPVGSPATIATMLDFCVRHEIAPMVETFPMSEVNDALQHLRDGKARYRVVLENAAS